MTKWLPPRALVLSWAGLLALLATTVFTAYLPLGAFNTVTALVIATGKAFLVAAIFMELRKRSGLTIAFAGAGFFWLGIMIWLAMADYLTRPPPASLQQPGMDQSARLLKSERTLCTSFRVQEIQNSHIAQTTIAAACAPGCQT
jgi:cytochrome c oxidase subunit 4